MASEDDLGPTSGDASSRTAIVFIHGQGQQRPMESVRELARTTWRSDPSLAETSRGQLRLWSTPDDAGAIFELRRLATEACHDNETSPAGDPTKRRYDFFEFYWAHMMEGNRLLHVMTWFFELLRKAYYETPKRLRPVRQAFMRFYELSALFGAAFAILTAGLILRFEGKPPTAEAWINMTEAFAAYFENPTSLAGLREAVAEWLSRAFLIGLAVFYLPAALFSFVTSERRKTVPEAHEPPSLKELKKQAARRVSDLKNSWVFVLGALLGIYFVIAALSPAFEPRDAPVILGAAAIGVFLIAEYRDVRQWGSYLLLVVIFTLVMARLEDGRIVSALTAASLAGVWLALRMNFVASTIVSLMATAAAITARVAMAERQEVYSATFSSGMESLEFLAWIYFFIFGSGFVIFLLTADQSPRRRLRWLGAVLLIAIAGATVMNRIEAAGYNPFAPWSIVYAAPIDTFSPSIGSILHLHFWMTSVVALGMLTLGAILAATNSSFLSPVMGDSARYLRATPENIAQRQKIRAAGVDLLERLHACGKYDRVIVVGHSLGSVVGYDVLTHFWGRRVDRLHAEEVEHLLEDVEAAARQVALFDEPAVRRAAKSIAEAAADLGVDRTARKVRDPVLSPVGDADVRAHEQLRQVTRIRLDRAAQVLAAAAKKRGLPSGSLRIAAEAIPIGPVRYAAVADALAQAGRTLKGSRRSRHASAGERLERAAVAFADMARNHARFRERQRAYAEGLAKLRDKSGDAPWLVSDFITLGSPLNYGPYLLAKDNGEFARRIRDRELPTCPPHLEKEPPRSLRPPVPLWRFSYERGGGSDPKARGARVFGPNHGAVFGPVRWTNLYFQTEGVLVGDVVGGPLWRHFDLGVADVGIDPASTGRLFAHNEYWRTAMSTVDLAEAGPDELPDHIAALRRALDLGRV